MLQPGLDRQYEAIVNAVKEGKLDEQAMKRLEEIVSRIDSNELDIDSLGVNLKEAQELIKFCRDKLYKADEEIKKMLDNNVSM